MIFRLLVRRLNQLCHSGHMSVIFHGVQNDFVYWIHCQDTPLASDKKLDPVTTLNDYMTNTALQCLTDKDGAIFLSLVKQYHGLSSPGIASILQEAISLEGLASQRILTKSSHPTAVTQAVPTGCSSNIAWQVGRWKSHTVFEDNYVHTMVPDNFVDNIIHM